MTTSSSEATRHPFEDGLTVLLRATVPATAIGLPLLLLPSTWIADNRLLVVSLHTLAVTVFVLVISLRLAPLGDIAVFRGSPGRRRLATNAALVAAVTGVAVAVSVATTAGLRLQPSLQYLQVLSTLDIAWSTAAVVLAARQLWGKRTSVVLGWMVGIICVASLVNYLRVIGFGPDGDWTVSAPDMLRLVIPVDVVAAVMALALTVRAMGRA